MPVKFRARIISDVAGSNRNRFDPALTTRVGDIDRVLGKNHWIIVGECDRSTAEPLRRMRDLLGRGRIGELVPFACLGNVPVLTKSTTEVTAGRAEREHTRTRQKMVQRFLLDWINAKP